MVRVTKKLWSEIAREQNPFIDAACSRIDGFAELYSTWNNRHIALLREMHDVAFGEQPPTVGLIGRAMDFLEGKL